MPLLPFELVSPFPNLLIYGLRCVLAPEERVHIHWSLLKNSVSARLFVFIFWFFFSPLLTTPGLLAVDGSGGYFYMFFPKIQKEYHS